MRRIVIAAPLAFALTVAAAPASAGPHYYGHWGGHGHVSGDAFLIGTGIVVGALALGALLSPPPRYAPAPVTYYPPPRRCVQDQVSRVLWDGRVQTGVRTTCY